MESTLRNMVMVLLLITLAASAAVGIVYQLTVDPIEKGKALKITNAIAEVLPGFESLDDAKVVDVDGDIVKIYPAKSGSNIIGYAVETFTNKGYAGKIKLLVGFLPDGTINGTSVISHNETPGLGNKIEKSKFPPFSAQFEGKDPQSFKLLVKKDGGDVDAITASTISSRAFSEAVQRAYDTLMQNK